MAQQLGNFATTSVPVPPTPPISTDPKMTAVVVGDGEVQLNMAALRNLGASMNTLFMRYSSERLSTEQKWLKNLRQYLGIYDPEIERMLPPNRSRAYPRLTRVKCVSMLSRLMNLMFPGNEDNWELKASPSPSMSPEAVTAAVEALMAERLAENPETAVTQELIDEAVRRLADANAAGLSLLIKDQLLELGGDQSRDWISLNRKVCESGIKFGIGVLEGPYVRQIEESGWVAKANAAQGFEPTTRTIFKPQYEFLPVWDFYPDMSARDCPGEGYFVRKVLGRSALRRLADRSDFFSGVVKEVLTTHPRGNYSPRSWENELRTMGTAVEGSAARADGREKYEVIIWRGPISGQTLREIGLEVSEAALVDEVKAELWMVENFVIKAEISPWQKLGVDMRTVHVFSFDEDDTSPIGSGLPAVVRDSQLSICAATRMSLDNASVTCGPNLEINTRLLRPDQDLTSVQPYKIWYRDDDGLTTQYPAVRRIEIDGHLDELQQLVRMFLDFAEMETFVGPSTGGDMSRMPSEPMRTAAGASALRGDAALPFKDIVRNYDQFTQSVIWSIAQFNRKFNEKLVGDGDYSVVARGATSLITKEVRGQQIDLLSQTLTPEERDHIDERKFIEAKMAARDLQGMLVSPEVAKARQEGKAKLAAEQAAKQDQMHEATVKKTLADAFKGVAQGQKNAANADQASIKAALDMQKEAMNEPQGNSRADGADQGRGAAAGSGGPGGGGAGQAVAG